MEATFEEISPISMLSPFFSHLFTIKLSEACYNHYAIRDYSYSVGVRPKYLKNMRFPSIAYSTFGDKIQMHKRWVEGEGERHKKCVGVEG